MATIPPRGRVPDTLGRSTAFARAREKDCGDCAPPELEWPVSDADLERCEIVFLEGLPETVEPVLVDGAGEGDRTRLLDVPEASDPPGDFLETLFAEERTGHEKPSFPDPGGLEPDPSDWAVFLADAHFQAERVDPVEQEAAPPDLSALYSAPLPPPRFESRSPWLALIGGVCCAVLAYLQFQTAPPHGQPRVESLLSSRAIPSRPAVGLPPRSRSRQIARTLEVPTAPALEPDDAINRRAVDRPVALATRAIVRPASLLSERVRPTTTSPLAERPAPAATPEAESTKAPAVALRADPPAPVPERESSRAAESLTALVSAAADSPARVVPIRSRAGEEDRIRSTLASFQTAYTQLNAKAARAVWPTVDERALARAFDGLKSQHLAFDRCEMTVKDAEASAACRGRSTYVPRVGAQSPRTYSAEWKFHLKKVDEEWQIDSASFR
jgi:hypothetical protein